MAQDEADTTRLAPMPSIQEETTEPTPEEQPVYQSPVNETKNNAETNQDLFDLSDDLKIEDFTDAKLNEGADSSQNDSEMPKLIDPCCPEDEGEFIVCFPFRLQDAALLCLSFTQICWSFVCG